MINEKIANDCFGVENEWRVKIKWDRVRLCLWMEKEI
jgi:hypothetical protein